MIIVEGSDCCGKSTLVKALALRYSTPVCHLGLPPVGTRHWDIVRKELLKNQSNTVYDRMVVGSYVFRIIKPDAHNINGVTLPELETWQDLTRNLGALVIRVTAEWPDVLERYRKRGDEYVNEAILRDSYDTYNNVFRRWIERCGPDGFMTLNTSKANADLFVEQFDLLLSKYVNSPAPISDGHKQLVKATMGDRPFHDFR